MNFVPDIYIDTMGYAFTLPLFKYIGGCSVACYVHYPTISTDMLEKVSQRFAAHNNARFIARNPILSGLKLIYYKLFAYVYGMVGARSDVIMVNSSWTRNHIVSLWKAFDRTHIVYPPCDTKEFLTLDYEKKLTSELKPIVSVGQFRPEKDHPLQLDAFGKFLNSQPAEKRPCYKLLLVGSCRNEEDSQRVNSLRDQCDKLNITANVEFRLNVTFSDLKKSFAESVVGIHTMWNEHFGIGNCYKYL